MKANRKNKTYLRLGQSKTKAIALKDIAKDKDYNVTLIRIQSDLINFLKS